jgi:hypothetical protein
MAAAILVVATSACPSDYPLTVDIDCYRHYPVEREGKPAATRCQGFLGDTLLGARYQGCFRGALLNARSAGLRARS